MCKISEAYEAISSLEINGSEITFVHYELDEVLELDDMDSIEIEVADNYSAYAEWYNPQNQGDLIFADYEYFFERYNKKHGTYMEVTSLSAPPFMNNTSTTFDVAKQDLPQFAKLMKEVSEYSDNLVEYFELSDYTTCVYSVHSLYEEGLEEFCEPEDTISDKFDIVYNIFEAVNSNPTNTISDVRSFFQYKDLDSSEIKELTDLINEKAFIVELTK